MQPAAKPAEKMMVLHEQQKHSNVHVHVLLPLSWMIVDEMFVQERGGMMTPEHVAEGFYRLVTQCENGSALAVMKNVPYMLIPDYSIPLIILLVALSKLVNKSVGPRVVTGHHLLATLTLLVFIFCYVITCIF